MNRERFGPYHLLERLAAGRFGAVWRGRDDKTGRAVAVRVLPAGFLADDAERRAYRQAALALIRNRHLHVADTLDFVTEGDDHAVVCEFVAGETLASRLKRGRLFEAEVARLGAQLAEGLASGHDRGVVHRFLNPRNVMIGKDGAAVLLDFGLPRHAAESLGPTPAPPPADTAANPLDRIVYAAPEQLAGRRGDGRSDLYALGVLMYEMLTGERPHHSSDPGSLAYQVAHTPAPPLSRFRRGLSPRIEGIVLKCLEIDRGDRYLSGHDLATDLKQLGDPARAPSAAAELRRAQQRWWMLGGVALLIALGMVAMFANVGRMRERFVDRLLTGRAGLLPGEIRSVAVLPLRSPGSEDDAEEIGIGLADQLARRLGTVSALKVVGPDPAAYPNVPSDSLPGLGRRWLVDAVVGGTFTRNGEQWRLRLEARRTADGSTLWQGSESERAPDEADLEVHLLNAMLVALRVTVPAGEQLNLARGRVIVPEAYLALLRARAVLLREDSGALAEAATQLRHVLDLDSTDAGAWSALAVTEIRARHAGWRVPDLGACARLHARAARALALESNDADAHLAFGYAAWRCDDDPVAAEANLRAAVALAPADPLARLTWAEFLGASGRLEERVAETRRALASAPWAAAPHVDLARCEIARHQFGRAVLQCRRAIEAAPRAADAWATMARAEAAAGRWDEALAARQVADSLAGVDRTRELLLRAAAARGDQAEVRERWRSLAEDIARGALPSFDAAVASLAAGDVDAALRSLARGVAGGELSVADLTLAPELDPIRSDRRMQALMTRLGETARAGRDAP